MEQDTNVTQTVEEAITFDIADIMGGDVSEENTAAQEETKPEETKDETPAPEAETAKEEGIEVTHLGEKKRLTGDELRTYAQKGMDYDHVKEQLNGYKTNKLFNAALRSAKAAGLSEDEFAEKLLGQMDDREIKKISTERNIPEEAAREIYESERSTAEKINTAQREKDELSRELDELREYKRIADIREAARTEWREFSEKHPEITSMDKLCKEAQEAIKAGKNLEEAYLIHQNKELEQKISAMEAAAKSPGSASSALGEEEPMDNFLRGFTGNYR